MLLMKNQTFNFRSKKNKCANMTPGIGLHNIFCPLKSNYDKMNAKHMFTQNQFHQRNAPILKFFAQLDDTSMFPRDQMKFRSCHILYFVEDGTIKVNEPYQRNSGFKQGCLINRNKIPKADNTSYHFEDLNVGKTVVFYGKVFKIIDCDPFTRTFLQEMGYRVGTPEPGLVDPIYSDRKEMDKQCSYRVPRQAKNTLMNFYKIHPKFLHFYVIYNYKPHDFEDICYASLYYDLVDGTIKIVDQKKLQDYHQQLKIGNFDPYLILRSTLVPKSDRHLSPIGERQTCNILNLSAISKEMHLQELMDCRSGAANNALGFLPDSSPSNQWDQSNFYYTANDFNLGITIDVFGRKVFIYDCDEFTKEFYRNEYSRSLTPTSLPEGKVSKYHKIVIKQDFGSTEDSLQSCRNLLSVNVLKSVFDEYYDSQQPRNSESNADILLKFFILSREGSSGNVLRFLCKVVTDDICLKNAYFIIKLFLEDDTIEIWRTNFGSTDLFFRSSSFLKRKKLTKPQPKSRNSGDCFYTCKDMFVGNTVYASQQPFLIVDADEYTYNYMERNCDIFAYSNVKYIRTQLFILLRSKLKKLSPSFTDADANKTGYVPYNVFRQVLFDTLSVDDLNEQEIKTLARHYAYEEYIGPKCEHLLALMQEELKKHYFSDFAKLEMLFCIHEMGETKPAGTLNGLLEPEVVYKVLRSFPLPIERDLLKTFLFKFPKINELVSYKKLVSALNYFDNPVNNTSKEPYAININWENVETTKVLNKISYNLFLRELSLDDCPNCT